MPQSGVISGFVEFYPNDMLGMTLEPLGECRDWRIRVTANVPEHSDRLMQTGGGG